MVAYACEHASSSALEQLFEILDKPREKTTPEDVSRAIGIFERCGALREAERICEQLKAQALAALDPIPHKLKSSLAAVTEYLAGRTK